MIRTLLSTKATTSSAGSFGLLILRLSVGLLMFTHGMPKLLEFSIRSETFDPIGLGGTFSLILVVFAEVFCSAGIILGLLTRLAAIPLVINMLVAVFVAHGGDPIAAKELGLLYLTAYTVILFTGPGKYSVDKYLWK